MVLGNYPAFGLSEAREMGREALKKVARGIDPAVDRKVSRAKTAATPTVAEAVTEFIERYAKPRNKSWQETDRIFKRYILPAWGDRLLPSIRHADVAALLSGIATDAPYMANRVLAAVRRFWNWCLEQGKTDTSPAANIMPRAGRSPVIASFPIRRLPRSGELASTWDGHLGLCSSSCS